MEKKLYSDYAVFKDRSLVIEVFKGTVLPDSIANTKTIQSKDPEFSYFYDVISDYRDTFFDTLLINVDGFCDFLKEKNIKYGDMHKNAILISTENQKVYVEHFIRLKSNENVRFFRNMDDALAWIGRSSEKEFIAEMTKELGLNPQIEWSLVADF